MAKSTSASKRNVLLRFIWHISSDKDIDRDVSLTCEVNPSAKNPHYGTLQVFDEAGKQLLFYDQGCRPLELFKTAEGNLATLWESDFGYQQLHVFAFSGGKVKRVLIAGSKVRPEFVYGPKLSNGSSQRIIFPNAYFAPDGKKEGSPRLNADYADIYTWNGKSYSERKDVPWADRLK